MELDRLKAFRQAAYQHLGKARDATFELTDAVLLTRTAYRKSGLVVVSSVSTSVAEYIRSVTRYQTPSAAINAALY